ncbi:MAG: tail fiber domain-containing protein, partial [Rectinemataceae bacterium]|nr:tail fiber domain-containing protein [Rectinemataceae bacterium]
MKDNITPLSEIKGLDAVKLLNPVAFKWNSWMQSNGSSSSDQFGFIAQDVALIFPNLVEQDKNTGFYKLDYQGFFAPLVKSIQELDVKVNGSGDIISSLALRVDTLEQQATASAELTTKKSAFADLVSLASSLNSTGSSTLISTLIQNPDFVKGIFNLGVEMPGIEPGRLGLTTQSSEPATPAPISLSQLLTNLVNNDSSHSMQLSSLASQVASLSGSLMPISPIPSLATSGAQLTLDALDVHDATVSGTLSVLGRTLLSDVGITGRLNIGLLSINGLNSSCSPLLLENSSTSPSPFRRGQGEVQDCSAASINTLSGPLKLQSDGLNGLDILNGKITIDTQGNITTQGAITAKPVTTGKINIITDTTDTASSSAPRSLGEVGS